MPTRRVKMLLVRELVIHLVIGTVLFAGGVHGGYSDDTCAEGRTVIVHLFDWKWTDIALECERFLGPNGYCGLQVSPPNEHREIVEDVVKRPWWERYQPISYLLDSRSGSRAQFADMVRRCNNVNVRVYVDAVVNHMCYASAGQGYGSGGSFYDSNAMQFPGVPYGPDDFNCCSCSMCTTGNCDIWDYNEPNQVRNCRLGTLLDLAAANPYVRGKIAAYFNDVIGLGVAGFRIDALKHMWPGDMEAILEQVDDLNQEWWPPGTSPFFFNEVIDNGGEAISAGEYTHLGRVTEFRYSKAIGQAFRNVFPLRNLLDPPIGEAWGMLPSGDALIFVDNHDNQRGHGSGGAEILTFWEPRAYKMATAFTLANDYAFTRIMSSHYWAGGRWEGDWIGPPSNADWSIKDVPITADGMCGDGWICEHRWRQIRNMVKFRNVVDGEAATNKWSNSNNQIAFSRGNKGFIAFNNEDGTAMDVTLPTGMAPGVYCDVISGQLDAGRCTGKEVYVDASGHARITLYTTDEDPMLAIHAESKLSDDVTTPTPPIMTTLAPTAPPPIGYSRTVVFVLKQTQTGQDAFLRGGVYRPGCSDDADTSTCAVPIQTEYLGAGTHYEKYNAWRVGNTRLNWYGAQAGQATYYGMPAQGSPMVWTTNVPGQAGYQPVNRYGPHHWLLDVQMDCAQTENGWFEVKSFLTSYSANGGWEYDVTQAETCQGTAGGSKPYSSGNHFGRCGFVNVFQFDSGACTIDNF